MTRSELVNKALKMIGINTRYSTANAEEIADGLGFLDDYMMSMNGIGKRLGYNFTDDPDADANLPDWAVWGVLNDFAVSICPYYDKPVQPSLITNAAAGMQTINARTAYAQPVQYPNRMPKGSGNHPLYGNRYYQQSDNIQTFNDFLEDDGGELIEP